MKRERNTYKTIEEHQAAIERNYKTLFFLLTICLVLYIAFIVQILK